MDTVNAIELLDLNHSYGDVKALDGLSLKIRQGEIFGFIGPDGAGKTTLFRILTTLLIPEQGKALVLGKDSVADYRWLRRRMGYMPGKFSLYTDLSVEENLNFFASVFGTSIAENYDLIRSIYDQLAPFKNRRAGALSGGMKQKLALCCSLIHKPEILFLDEPTTGVDAVSRTEFWDMLKNIQRMDITIVVSTPYMDEARLCDRVALIDKGHILDLNTPDALESGFPKPLYAIKGSPRTRLLHSLRDMPEVHWAYSFGVEIHCAFNKAPQEPELKHFLEQKGIQDLRIKAVSADIEDVFIEALGGAE